MGGAKNLTSFTRENLTLPITERMPQQKGCLNFTVPKSSSTTRKSRVYYDQDAHQTNALPPHTSMEGESLNPKLTNS